MRDLPAYCVAALAVLVSLVCLGLAIEANSQVTSLEHRVTELNCVVHISEDGMGWFVDDEDSQACLRERLGWPLKP